jgi:hypothetical protein
MNLDNFKSILPLALFYCLIFMDPYSYLIPIKEPKLVFDEKVTWLLDGKNGHTDFAVAYNEKYENSLLDKNNAFRAFYPFFYKDYESKPGFEFLKKYEITVTSDLKIKVNEDFLNLIYEKNTVKFIDNSFKNPALLNAKEDLLKIYEKVELGENYSFYEEPLFTTNRNLNHIEFQYMIYIFGLYYFSEKKENVKIALKHLRFLSNTFNKNRLILILDIYKKIIDLHNISNDELKDFEAELPPWPEIRTLILRNYKAATFISIIHPSDFIINKLTEIRKKNKDIYLNQTITLEQIKPYFDFMETNLPDARLDSLNKLSMARVTGIKWLVKQKKEERTLAEKALFSLSVKERYESFANNFSKQICQIELFYLEKVYEKMKILYANESKGKKDGR